MNRVRRNAQNTAAQRANDDVEASSGRCKFRGPDRKGPSCRAIIVTVAATFVLAFVWRQLNWDPHQEEWAPRAWGTPWGSLSPSWAESAARRKPASDVPVSEATRLKLLKAASLSSPVRLKYPVLWAGPFFTHSGYGTEAISYVAGLLQHGLVAPEDLWITQAGDEPHDDVVAAMDPSLRQLLWDQEYRNITRRLPPALRDRPLIVVCHTFPDCWRTPMDDLARRWTLKRTINGVANFVKYSMFFMPREKDNGCPCPNKYIKDRVVYRVGRSMFETERLPAGLAAYANHLDEVLVPSDFNVRSFSAAGVPVPKLHTLAQGINTTLFDPDAHEPLDLETLKGQLVVGTELLRTPSAAAASAGGAGKTGRRLVKSDPERGMQGLSLRHAQVAKAEAWAQTGWHGQRVVSQSGPHASDVWGLQHNQLEGQSASSSEAAQQEDRADGSGAVLTAEGRQGVRLHASGVTTPGPKLRGGALHVDSQSGPSATVSTVGSGLGALPHVRPPLSADRPFRFLSVFKWEARKGWDVLLAAFLSEFGAGEHVELHIVTHEFSTRVDDFRASVRGAVAKLLNVSDADGSLDALPRVYVYNKYIPDNLYPGLYKAVDALVVPTHGEGWGRPQFEAMAMGLPVISTNWSGLTAFMNESVAFPIRVEGIVDVVDDGPSGFKWFKGQRWAQPSPTHLRHLMRHVVANATDAAAKGAAARALIRSEFSIKAVARKALVELLRMQHQVDVALGGAGDTATTSPSAPGTGGSASWASSVSWTGWDRNVTGSWGSAGTQQAPKSRWRKLWG